jgi:pimeloyl-ACP methyl ester carboxylesterase
LPAIAPPESSTENPPLLLIHPIGVGLSRRFWDRFCQTWFALDPTRTIYNPDLLGCGESAMPAIAYAPEDWADQLQHFLKTVVKRPVVVIAQGALTPVALRLAEQQETPNLIDRMVFSDPPAWAVITGAANPLQQRVGWNLLDTPLGQGFYRYARRSSFLRSFSARQLFAQAENVDQAWIETLVKGSEKPESRFAVFAFLAGFWRQNYQDAIANLPQPTLVVIGDSATSISRSGKSETLEQRMANYLRYLPKGQGVQIEGRNVLPYESTEEFVAVVRSFLGSS